ncbi:hypothetical protein [Imhoffiella purpurea]|uniref:hypothetical protein n=1 Tax=Imhoffiella purpurea TaxID=1249627 RepID=UPI0012FD992E|nr:hypothetical protein [Imhoffiella purpurea]
MFLSAFSSFAEAATVDISIGDFTNIGTGTWELNTTETGVIGLDMSGATSGQHYGPNESGGDFKYAPNSYIEIGKNDSIIFTVDSSKVASITFTVWDLDKNSDATETIIFDGATTQTLTGVAHKIDNDDAHNLGILSAAIAPNSSNQIVITAGSQNGGRAIGGMTVMTTVPLPSAFWLFGSALVGLIGIMRAGSTPTRSFNPARS